VFWTLKRWYLRSFLPMTVPSLVNYSSFSLFEPIFPLMNAKTNAGIDAFFKKSKIVM